ncbi:hypothetical protein Y032_0043g869 [Ancylostoma ceylanicum]|uniref:HIG1 domain-containing protein n=1 Tax=Ancylostoma ceylanicum TaxID=53326 RepID=A0A016UFQ8_9BILA|nr:hypothetical protein Y032_0043g869 [Ancylostoma ceylanicum]
MSGCSTLSYCKCEACTDSFLFMFPLIQRCSAVQYKESLLLTFSLTYRSSFIGDKLGAQKYMQYRIMAQFFTVTALVAGVTFFGATYEDEEVTKARENAPPPTAILHKH